MAQIHAIAGLGYGKQYFFVETSVGIDFAQQQNPAQSHEEHAGGIVEPGSLPLCCHSRRALYGEHASAAGEHPFQKTSEAKGKTGNPARQGNGQSPSPTEFSNEFSKIKTQQHVAQKTAEVIEQSEGVPAGLAPKRVFGGIGNA